MNIWHVIDRDLYAKMLDGGYIRIQVHENGRLLVANYTEKAQFEHTWNDVTMNCRGLIWDSVTERVVARGFPKFFNWDDTSQPYPPKGPVLRSPKMDGSLGILYRDDAERVSVATRGSFTSDQALWATRKLLDLNAEGSVDLHDLDLNTFSYLVEIIYPSNRIVVNYGDQERLVLLDVLNTATGRTDLDEFDRVHWVDKVERRYFPEGFTDAFVHDIPRGEEGFVIYWPWRDYRVKMKAAEYLDLHRMLFSLNERAIWERLGMGETVPQICAKLPDEFHNWVAQVANDLGKQATRIELEVNREFRDIIDRPLQDRKAFAARAVSSPNKQYLFMLYDRKSIWDEIWKSLRPVGGKTFSSISEDVA